MEKCLESVIEILDNEPRAVEQLKIFCRENERHFSFHHIDPLLRRQFIEVILKELSKSDYRNRTEFESAALSSLRILSRDKHALGLLVSEKACETLIKLSGLFVNFGDVANSTACKENETKDTDDGENKARLKKTPDIDSKNNGQITAENSEKEVKIGADASFDVAVTNSVELPNKASVDFMDLTSVKARESVIVEGLKCLCNVVFQSSIARGHCSKHNLTEVVIKRLKWFEKEDFQFDVKFFDLRLLFLLTALGVQERSVAVNCGGLCVLTHALDSCVPERDEREKAHCRGPDWAIGDNGEVDSNLSVLERAAAELSPSKFKLTEEQLKITEEILKTLFNITLNICAEEKDTREHCERIILIIRTILIKSDEVSISKLFNHSVNLLVNLPKQCMGRLVLSMPRPVWKQLKNYDEQRRTGQFRTQYEQYNTQALKVMLTELYERVKVANERPQREFLLPLMSALCCVARGNSICRKYLRNEVLPPMRNIGHERPEEGKKIRGRLVKLMTSSVDDIKEAAADFLFVLCKENVDRLVKYTGYGNAAGLLASRGLMAGGQGHMEDYSSDDEDSDTEEYAQVKDQIDPITGAIPRNDGSPNPMDDMTEEEKEAEAEKLAAMLRKLNSHGIISAMTVDPQGNLTKMKIPDEFHSDDGGSCSGS